MSDDSLLKIKNLKVHFDTLEGPVEALHDVSLEVKKGQIMGLVGESGCGKSVTSLTSIGLATCIVDEGSIKYDGKEMIFHENKEKNLLLLLISNFLPYFSVFFLFPIGFVYLMPFMEDPLFGFLVIMGGFVLIAISMAIKFFIHSDNREHDKFMRYIRGNEISMIFQEPMTALNPLYTVEKQIFEVMKSHDRLSESSISKSTKLISSLKSPLVTLYNWILYDRFSAAIFSSLLMIYLVVSCMGPGLISSWGTKIAIIFYASAEVHLSCHNYSDDIIIYSFLLIPFGILRSSIMGESLFSVLRTIPFTFTLSLIYAIILWTPNPVVGTVIGLFLVVSIPLVIVIDFLQLDPNHRNQVIKILEDVQIPNPRAVVTMYPHELSGGMRQRVMIAMMMSCEPKLLIADEPTTALDVTIQAQILHLMRDLRDRKGTSIMLITHDLGVIAELCDSVSVMYAGSVVETGTIEDILANPRMPYTIGLLHSIPKIVHSDEREGRTSLPIIPGQVPDPNTHFDGCRFHPRCPFADDLCRSIRPEMIEVSEGHYAACHHTDLTIISEDVESSFDIFSKEFEGVGGEVIVR